MAGWVAGWTAWEIQSRRDSISWLNRVAMTTCSSLSRDTDDDDDDDKRKRSKSIEAAATTAAAAAGYKRQEAVLWWGRGGPSTIYSVATVTYQHHHHPAEARGLVKLLLTDTALLKGSAWWCEDGDEDRVTAVVLSVQGGVPSMWTHKRKQQVDEKPFPPLFNTPLATMDRANKRMNEWFKAIGCRAKDASLSLLTGPGTGPEDRAVHWAETQLQSDVMFWVFLRKGHQQHQQQHP